jgi:type IV secretory pathway VirB10-like protein
MPLPTLPKTSSEARAPGEKSRWGIDLTHGQQQRRERSDKEQQEDKRRDSAQNLLKHAIWATPAVPTKTLYRQQAIPGVTIDEMISDIPGQYKIRVSVPVFDRFRREVELIPKDSVIILTQKRVPGYGEKRLELVVEEIQPPTPEVISLKATVGDKEGAAGVGGNVDNHIPQLVLATLISTAVNIGGRVLAGNPQGYQYSVGQEITRDVGQQVSQDTKSIVDRTLRIPPTITVPAQTPVSVSLQENVMFSRAPLVVR